MFNFVRLDNHNYGIADEADQFNGTSGWISKRFMKANDAPILNGIGGSVVNSDGRCIASRTRVNSDWLRCVAAPVVLGHRDRRSGGLAVAQLTPTEVK